MANGTKQLRALDWPAFQHRLTAAADDVDELGSALKGARELRNRIILEAVDAGFSQRPVADAARVAPSHVHRVLAVGDEETA